MIKSNIRPLDSHGAWTLSHSSHFIFAQRCLESYREELKKLLEEESKIRKENDSLEKNYLDSLISHLTSDLRSECHRHAISAHLYACMAIEGFFNFYGVVRLGKVFYKSNLERTGITEKLSILMLMCQGITLSKEMELPKTVRQLFDSRNALVHPKTREVFNTDPRELVNKHPSDFEIEDNMRKVKSIIAKLCEMDPAIRRKMHFPMLSDQVAT